MTMPTTNEFANFASRFNVALADAYVLPTLFERTAVFMNIPVRAFLSQATYSNRALGEYMANCAKQVSLKDKE